MTDSPDAFRARREGNLFRMLFRATRHMTDETVIRMRARGVKDMQPAYTRLLGNLDTEGTRIGALARKMGTTRQAVAQLSKEIEKAGFIERQSDPTDGRSTIVKFTKKGRAALLCAVEVIATVEEDYAKLIGRNNLEQIKENLGDLLAKADASGAFGLD